MSHVSSPQLLNAAALLCFWRHRVVCSQTTFKVRQLSASLAHGHLK